jgi:ferredoxin-NADP reductase
LARAAVLGRLTWQVATVEEIVDETPRVRTIVLDVPDWPGHRAGQHLDIRLTAEDGYRAEREYSIASAPDEPVAITVERLDDGEVSPYLTEELRRGDGLELRGPIGGYFVWDRSSGGPLLLIAGGSGVVPFRAMLRHYIATGSDAAVQLLYSARSLTRCSTGGNSSRSCPTTASACTWRSRAPGPRTGRDIAGASTPSCCATCHRPPINTR